MAHYYSVFGSVLESEIEFPELRECKGNDVRWTFGLESKLPAMKSAVLMGEEPIYADIVARLYKHSEGFRIRVADTGAFDISANGSQILWEPNAEPWWDFGRGHLVGRVLAMAMQIQGMVSLHGSAVYTPNGTIAFLAAKFTGKSTLALRLSQSGAPLVTDDTLPIELLDQPLAWPGVHTIRLRSAEEAPGEVESTGRDGKFRISDFAVEDIANTPQKLSALYLLRSIKPDNSKAPVSRNIVRGMPAVLNLIAHAKIGQMLGSAWQLELFSAMNRLAAKVPVYELFVQRDHQLLPQVVSQILEWHNGTDVSTDTV